MVFTSWVFVIFFISVYTGYLCLRKQLAAQNLLLLVASYVFYGYWDYRFCSLLAISTIVDFAVGQGLATSKNPRTRKWLLVGSLTTNLGLLGFFKYFDFFAQSTIDLFNAVGMEASPLLIEVVLPVGISFYTFQTLSYSIDVYRRRMEPTRNFIDFALYVSFFPQLVAGPIERASHLLPQISKPRSITFDEWQAGAFLLLWGFWKKLVVADNVAKIVNEVFRIGVDNAGNPVYPHDGAILIVGILAFAFQIYCDFSAYSDIARGVSKMMGFDLMVNFRLPYFAISPSDFWRRWHISLSTWLRDYLYIPLGGNRGGNAFVMRNLALTMLLGGLWHGASWNFVIWGAFHGGILMIYRAIGIGATPPGAPGTMKYHLSRYGLMAVMFVLTLIGWVLFRCTTAGQIGHVLTQWSLVSDPDGQAKAELMRLVFYAGPLVLIQIWQQRTGDLLCMLRLALPLRILFCGWLLVWILIFGVRVSSEFIYFQF